VGYLPLNVHVLSATVSSRANRWFVSVRVEEDIHPSRPSGDVVGLDVGILVLGTTSEGTRYENPRALERVELRLTRLHRALARTAPGSCRRRRLGDRIRRLHLHAVNVRSDAIHKMTTQLTRTKAAIVVEDLKVSWMVKHPTLRKALLDAAFGEIRCRLEYKSAWYGSQLIKAPRFFPSSRRCSRCGAVREDRLKLVERLFRCDACGEVLDRDINAARNLLHVAVSSTETENGLSSGLLREAAVKQEPGMPRASAENGGTTSRLASADMGTLPIAGIDREE